MYLLYDIKDMQENSYAFILYNMYMRIENVQVFPEECIFGV